MSERPTPAEALAEVLGWEWPTAKGVPTSGVETTAECLQELAEKIGYVLVQVGSSGIGFEYAVEYPAGVTQISEDPGDVEEWVQWIVDGQLVRRTVTHSEWQPVDPEAERRCTCCGHERMECDCVACDCFATGDGQ